MTHRPIDIADLDRVQQRDLVRPDLEWVPISAILIDDRYQRPLGPKNRTAIRRIAEIFDWAEFTPCLVAPLGGGQYALIDGQHRTHAAALAGQDAVPCLIVPMDFARQARAFAAVNGRVTAISVFHIYRAALASGEPWALEARKVVEHAGGRLMTGNASSSAKKPGEIYCIGLIRKLVEAGHASDLRRGVFAVMESALSGNRDMWSSLFLDPWLAVVIARPDVSPGDLIRALDSLDLVRMDRTIADLRTKPAYRTTSVKVLRRQGFEALIKVRIDGVAA